MRIGTVLGLTVTALACVRAQPATVRTVDAFERPELWRALPASGVELKVSGDRGRAGGSALRLDFDFRGRGGWAAVNRALPVSLPDNYELSFWLKGDAPKNTLELKLIDQTGENVWWVNRPEFEFAGDWRRVTFRKRHVTFAWGPARGGDLREAAAIEFAITAGTGGRGTVWIDDLTLAPRDPVRPYDLQPTITASTESNAASRVFDADSATFWRSKTGGTQYLTIDFRRSREFGGLRIDWLRPGRARDYDVQISGNGRDWETIRAVRAGGRARDYLALPETETRWIRLQLLRGGEQDGFGIREIDVLPLEFGATRNRLFEVLAHEAPRGHYPKYFLGAQSYWTIIGVPGDPKEALLDAQGMLEVDARAFSLEPFIYAHGRLLTWADGGLQQSLERGDLPVPSVRREAENFALTITAWAAGDPGSSKLWARYRIQNRSTSAQRATFYVAMRPFQVNPTWQFLNNPGGASVVRVIESNGARIDIDQRQIWPVTQPSGFGAAPFDQGDITEWLRRGELPEASRVDDPVGHASSALAYTLDLPAGGTQDVIVVTPMHTAAPGVPTGQSSRDAAELAQKSLHSTIQGWSTELDRIRLELPGDAARIARALRTNLAYILINQDHAAIQPGSRAYQRSWIRDGSLTSAALLRLGRAAEVRKFIEWYASFQYADGKVPCCVDHRGADPVPEHDSHGQLIYLIAEYYRHTNDAALVERLWPQVE
ncbi:MAG TPA: discoidin domain-containing protein, partial [Longimicrobiales bacterium]|nr:discoidin domain-containing protein [Longimicrobiales bacterium]